MGCLGSNFPGDGARDKTQRGMRIHMGVKSGSQQEKEPFPIHFAVRVFQKSHLERFHP